MTQPLEVCCIRGASPSASSTSAHSSARRRSRVLRTMISLPVCVMGLRFGSDARVVVECRTRATGGACAAASTIGDKGDAGDDQRRAGGDPGVDGLQVPQEDRAEEHDEERVGVDERHHHGHVPLCSGRCSPAVGRWPTPPRRCRRTAGISGRPGASVADPRATRLSEKTTRDVVDGHGGWRQKGSA